MAETHTRTAKIMQQEFANNYGTNRAVIWDLYTSNDKNILKEKLLQLIPDAFIDLEIISEDRNLTDAQKNEKAIKLLEKNRRDNKKLSEIRDRLLKSIWVQRKYCNGDLLMSIIFILHIKKLEDSLPIWLALHLTEYEIHPLFRVRKCKRSNHVEKCCMIFVDENARVYQNWDNYITENTLPEGIIVAPAKGIYDFDDDDNVKLECSITPESTISKKALNYVDKGTSIIGLGAAVVPIAALAIPVTAPVLVASTIAAVGGGIWSLARSAANLADRGLHEESISLNDRQARASWLGVAGGAIGLGASGASQGLIRYANAGNEINKVTHLAVNGINIASLTVNGVGITNGLYDVILKSRDEKLSKLDILQLSASLVLFTHSLYNFQYVSSIVQSTKSDGMLSDFRKTLSNIQRKMFGKMVDDTIRIQGPTEGNIEVVRAIGTIPDIPAHFSGNVKQALVTPQNATSFFNAATVPKFIEITVKFLLDNSNILNESDLRKCIIRISERLIEAAVTALITIARNFSNGFFREIESEIGIYIPFEKILWETFNIANKIAGTNANITPSWLNMNSQEIIRLLKVWIVNFIQRDTNNAEKLCNKCGGYYSITEVY